MGRAKGQSISYSNEREGDRSHAKPALDETGDGHSTGWVAEWMQGQGTGF